MNLCEVPCVEESYIQHMPCIQKDRQQTAIIRSLQRCEIGFKSGLWLGHSRTSTE